MAANNTDSERWAAVRAETRQLISSKAQEAVSLSMQATAENQPEHLKRKATQAGKMAADLHEVMPDIEEGFRAATWNERGEVYGGGREDEDVLEYMEVRQDKQEKKVECPDTYMEVKGRERHKP